MPAYFTAAVQLGGWPFQAFVRRCMEGQFPLFSPISIIFKAVVRDAVRSGQVDGCSQCKAQPQTTGELCFVCDRRSKALKPRIRELDADGVVFKSR
jgi:hypothetical protein